MLPEIRLDPNNAITTPIVYTQQLLKLLHNIDRNGSYTSNDVADIQEYLSNIAKCFTYTRRDP